jgi:hypothetical protein
VKSTVLWAMIISVLFLFGGLIILGSFSSGIGQPALSQIQYQNTHNTGKIFSMTEIDSITSDYNYNFTVSNSVKDNPLSQDKINN